MAGEWIEKTWGDLATLEYGKALRGYEQRSGKYYVYGTNGPIGYTDSYLYNKPGVIIGRKGAYRGVHFAEKPFFVIDTAFYLKPKVEFDMRWAYYQLLTQNINAMDSGSAIPSTSREDFYGLPLLFPPIVEQVAIAQLLGTLEQKITLNQRMNDTLEGIAQALFKSWFVDFDPVKAKAEGRKPECIDDATAALFPSTFTESSLGLIPEGWEVTTVEEIAQQVAMGPFGSSIKVSTFVSEGIPIISGQHLKDVMLTDSEFNFVTEEHAEKLKKANVKRGDVIFTHAGNIGQVSYIPEGSKYERYVLSQRQFYLRCNEQKMSPLFIVYFFRSPEGQHRLLANASQTGVPSIARPVSYLRTIPFTKPPKKILQEFDKIILSLHSKILANSKEVNNLSELRDLLLPRLISGKLRIADDKQ